MPQVAEFIDELREVFGREEVDGWIRKGLRDGTFRAEENGTHIGGSESMGKSVQTSGMA